MSTPKHHLNRYQARHPNCIIHCDNTDSIHRANLKYILVSPYPTLFLAISCYCPLTAIISALISFNRKWWQNQSDAWSGSPGAWFWMFMLNPWHSWIFRRTAAVCIRLSRRKGEISQAKYEMSYLLTLWYKRILNTCYVIAEYEQSLIDAAYSVNVSIYGINPNAEFDQYMNDAAYSVIITTE